MLTYKHYGSFILFVGTKGELEGAFRERVRPSISLMCGLSTGKLPKWSWPSLLQRAVALWQGQPEGACYCYLQLPWRGAVLAFDEAQGVLMALSSSR